MSSRDARFDGVFFTAVATTGIYCRPSCPARTPARRNVRFFSTSAAARQAGYRACKRCLPDAAPGSPEWNLRADVASRAIVMISDGVVDREGVGGLARRLGYSERQVRRQLVAELGVGPLELARSRRVDTARLLLESTDLPVSAVAFASGFSSIRQFNESIRAAFDRAPREVRNRAASRTRSSELGTLTLRLPCRAPIALADLLGFLGLRAVPGVEEWDGVTYRRVLDLPNAPGIVGISTEQPTPGVVLVTLELADLRDLTAAVARTRRMLDLDADPIAVDRLLAGDALLAPMVELVPGKRVPGHPDPSELAVRAVLGQQVSVKAARSAAGSLAARYGTPLATPSGSLTVTFPRPAVLRDLDQDTLAMPHARRRALVGLVRALDEGRVDLSPGADRDATVPALLALEGIGSWTASYIRMRACGDPDAFVASDLGVRRALESAGLKGDPRSASERAESWRPWRAYAVMHLWGSLAPATSPDRADRPGPTGRAGRFVRADRPLHQDAPRHRKVRS